MKPNLIFKILLLSFIFTLFTFGCNDEEPKTQKIPIIDSYVFNSIEYPNLNISLLNSHPYVFNKGGYIDELGYINDLIDFNKSQSDTTTLLVYRQDIDMTYPLNNIIVNTYKVSNENINVSVTYEVNKGSSEYENRYMNIICIKVPKIIDLNTFSYESAIRIVY